MFFLRENKSYLSLKEGRALLKRCKAIVGKEEPQQILSAQDKRAMEKWRRQCDEIEESKRQTSLSIKFNAIANDKRKEFRELIAQNEATLTEARLLKNKTDDEKMALLKEIAWAHDKILNLEKREKENASGVA